MSQPFGITLPQSGVSNRVSIAGRAGTLAVGERREFARLEGPGCIRHIWMAMTREHLASRQCILRITFDGASTPHVEAPAGDFFGVMHGLPWYPINTRWISVQEQTAYNCYFPMPFAEDAVIEFEAGEVAHHIFLMVDWHSYPEGGFEEERRFCSRWRREMPTQSYGEDFLLCDIPGPGRFAGFAYGVRLLDEADRWSHGGADNLYIDGMGDHPAYLRGIGGEDTFGTSYGGALHSPDSHLHAGMPYYLHEDTGAATPRQRITGYRLYDHDAVSFRESLHVRFGSMRNDICATAWWYQSGEVRPYFDLPAPPKWYPGVELPRGTCDRELESTGEWWCCGPFDNSGGRAMNAVLLPELAFDPAATFDGGHSEQSAWSGANAPVPEAVWSRRRAMHGFIDFNHLYRPRIRGVAPTGNSAAIARCVLNAPAETDAVFHIGWDDQLRLTLNDSGGMELGEHAMFRAERIPVRLRAGGNTVCLKLTNSIGLNHGGWAFSFRCLLPDGRVLLPA